MERHVKSETTSDETNICNTVTVCTVRPEEKSRHLNNGEKMAVVIVFGAHISEAEKIRDKLGCVAIVCDGNAERAIQTAVRSIVHPTVANVSGDPVDNPWYGKDILVLTDGKINILPNDSRIKAIYNHTYLDV